MGTSSWLREITTEVACFVSLSAQSFLKVPGHVNLALFQVVDDLLDEVEECVVVVWQDSSWYRVNCPEYRGSDLGKRKPVVISKGEGIVEAVGESNEVHGVGFSWRVGVGSCERDSILVVDLCDEALREETGGVCEGGSSYMEEGGSYSVCKGVGSAFRSGSKKHLQAQGRDDRGHGSLAPLLATSVAETC